MVVFADAVGAAGGAGFDLAGAESHCKVGDGGVLGFTRTVRHHSGVVIALRELHGVDGFRERADLVDLDEDGVGHLFLKTHLQTFHVGHEKVVTHELAAVADGVGEEFPAVPVVFGHTVLDGDDRVFVTICAGVISSPVDHFSL